MSSSSKKERNTMSSSSKKGRSTMSSFSKQKRNTMSGKSLNPESSSGLLKLRGEYGDKSLFICSFEMYRTTKVIPHPFDFSYVVRSINLPDLLSSSSENLELREVARKDDNDLPNQGGCGVLGTKIVFASGLKFSPIQGFGPFGPDSGTDAYAFDVRDPDQGIVKMPGELNGGKHKPLMAEFAGKLYVLYLQEYNNFVSFEVFDPQQGTWSRLPKYPDYGFTYSYAIAGSKLFMSSLVPKIDESYYSDYLNRDPSIRCFDLAAAPDAEWRTVPSMCRGGPFPFTGRALVLDLPEHSNKKLLFSYKDVNDWVLPNILLVHLMSLDENQEDIIELMEVNLPDAAVTQQLGDCHFFHLGGNNVCIVTTQMRKPEKKYKADDSGMVFTVQGAAIPFQFEFDISKVDKDRKNCFTGQFHPPRIFEYHIRPDSNFRPHTLGCFVL